MIINELQPGIVTATIEPHEADVIDDLTQDLIPRLGEISEPYFLDAMQERSTEAKKALPELAQFMGRLAAHEGPKVTVVDFPSTTVDGVRPTPLRHLQPGEQNLFAPDVYRGALIGLADWYGYGYTTQQNSAIHNNIVQVKQLEQVAGHSASAPHELGLHVEDASYNLGAGHDISPDFLTLHYFRNPHLVPTIVSMPDWEELSKTTRDLLSEEWFYNCTNPAQGGAVNNPTRPVSVLYGPSNDPWLRLNTAKLDLDSYNPDQQAALVEMRDHLEDRRIELGLKAGQIAIIDNRRVLHGRPAFKPGQEPQYDGTDRWQRRLVVTNDAGRIQQHEASYRVVDPESVIR